MEEENKKLKLDLEAIKRELEEAKHQAEQNVF